MLVVIRNAPSLSALEVNAARAIRDAADFARRATAVEKAAGTVRRGYGGGCWLWFSNNTDAYVRSLLKSKRVFVNARGKYLADLREFKPVRGREQRQEMAEALARDLRNSLGVQCQYYSVAGEDDSDAMAYFHEDAVENDLYFNVAD